jgi:hypothetical protein
MIEIERRSVRSLLFLVAGGLLAVTACQSEWDAAKGRENLASAGFQVGSPEPDRSATAQPGVKEGECFDASREGKTAHVCVWTCETSAACTTIPQQPVWQRGTIGRRLVLVDTKDEAFGYVILSSINP